MALSLDACTVGDAVAPIVRRATATAQPMTDKENADG
jgi:hypothetical protein